MRALSFIVSALLAGSALAQAPASVYTPPGRDLSVPTFINATVTRVDTRNNTITFRSESREVSLTVEGAAVASLGRLRAGDDVLLGYRIDGRTGRPVQVVTAILAGEEMAQRGLVATTLSPLGGGVAGGTRTGTTTITGTSANDTTATRVARGTFSTPLSVTGGGVATGTTVTGTRTRTGSVTTFSTSGGVTRTTGAAGVVSGTTGVIAPTTTATLAGVQTGRASGTVNTGGTTLATPVQTLPGNVGAVAGGPFNTVGLNGAGVNAGALNAGVNTADVAAPGTFSAPGSPFSSVIPSLPSVVGQLNVVAPPQSAPALPDELPVGAARDFATRDYDNAVRTLALKANEIDAHWFRYRDGCLRTSALTADIDRGLFTTNRDREWFVLFDGDVLTPADDNCRQLMVEMTRMANDWRDLMNRMEETARKNDVLPGAMRESRQRYRVEF